jgi:hypothetical protein
MVTPAPFLNRLDQVFFGLIRRLVFDGIHVIGLVRHWVSPFPLKTHYHMPWVWQ